MFDYCILASKFSKLDFELENIYAKGIFRKRYYSIKFPLYIDSFVLCLPIGRNREIFGRFVPIKNIKLLSSNVCAVFLFLFCRI